jgi:Xaa-Pro aminopeptidase
MEEKNLDAFLVYGNAENNPPMMYLTGGGHVTHATLIKKRGQAPVLFCGLMERDEAAKSGLTVRLYDDYPWQNYAEKSGGDQSLLAALRLQHIMDDMGIKGRVGVFGNTELSLMFAVLSHLSSLKKDIQFVGESRENSLFLYAMETKEENEVARIRRMGKITTEVVGKTADYLTSCVVNEKEQLLDENSQPLKLGRVREKINLWLAERNASPSEGFIFSLGRDSAVPHSQGNPEDIMKLGETIVFDIYPQEPGGGYFYDFTRTWSLGYAKPGAQELYDQVQDCYKRVVASLKVGMNFKEANELTCEIFEKYGHVSPRTEKNPQSGYIHSVGHGVGINIHERPFSGLMATDDNVLRPGVVMTIEPGLYYPDNGMGFRIEDTYTVKADGSIEILADYPYDFVLKMKH